MHSVPLHLSFRDALRISSDLGLSYARLKQEPRSRVMWGAEGNPFGVGLTLASSVLLMQRLSYWTETVLSNMITRNKIVLSFKDSPRKPLGRRPLRNGKLRNFEHLQQQRVFFWRQVLI